MADDQSLLEFYKLAVETRKLEIEMFWKRSLFFWGFITTIAVGYNQVHTPIFKFALAHLGLFLSFAWYFVNRGSKFWQEEWEKVVEDIEMRSIQICELKSEELNENLFSQERPPLFYGKSKEFARGMKAIGPFFNLLGPFKFSVSKIATLVSLVIALGWASLIFYKWWLPSLPMLSFQINSWWFSFFMISGAIFVLMRFCRTNLDDVDVRLKAWNLWKKKSRKEHNS